jgi:hypothetical protein
VNALPVIAVNASTPVCAGQPVTLTATGAASYTYSGIGATSPISAGVCSFTPNAPVGVTVKGTSAEGCVDSVMFNLIVGICNTITEAHGIKCSIFPNPTSGPLVIQAPGTADIFVYDGLGQLILSDLMNGEKIVDLSGYPRGIYFLVLQNGNTRGLYRVVRE